MASRLKSAQPAEARVSILLYDALDFSTDRDDCGGQTRESLSWIASPSAAVARLDPARFAHQVRHSRKSFAFDAVEHSQREDNHKARRAFRSELSTASLRPDWHCYRSLVVRADVLPHLVMPVRPFVPALRAPVVEMMSNAAIP